MATFIIDRSHLTDSTLEVAADFHVAVTLGADGLVTITGDAVDVVNVARRCLLEAV